MYIALVTMETVCVVSLDIPIMLTLETKKKIKVL